MRRARRALCGRCRVRERDYVGTRESTRETARTRAADKETPPRSSDSRCGIKRTGKIGKSVFARACVLLHVRECRCECVCARATVRPRARLSVRAAVPESFLQGCLRAPAAGRRDAPCRCRPGIPLGAHHHFHKRCGGGGGPARGGGAAVSHIVVRRARRIDSARDARHPVLCPRRLRVPVFVTYTYTRVILASDLHLRRRHLVTPRLALNRQPSDPPSHTYTSHALIHIRHHHRHHPITFNRFFRYTCTRALSRPKSFDENALAPPLCLGI